MAGRPSTYSDELADAICDRIKGGASLRRLCAEDGMPDRTTVMRWLAIHDDFAAKYASARAMQADYLEEEMAEIEDRTLAGEVDPAAARAVLGSKQWRAAKLAPKKYGDKLDVDVKGTLTVKLDASDDGVL